MLTKLRKTASPPTSPPGPPGPPPIILPPERFVDPPGLLTMTTDSPPPGYRVVAVLGSAWGTATASPAAEKFPLVDAVCRMRNDALGRLIVDAHARGANAIIGLRYDTCPINGIYNYNQATAYGTAVRLEPVGKFAAEGQAHQPQG